MLLDGLHIPITTPFYPDDRLYLRKLEHNVERYTRTPAAGLVLLSGIGEASLLSDEETRQALSSAIAAAAPEKVMIANVSRDSVSGTLGLAEHAGSLRYDAILLQVPGVLRSRVDDTKSRLTYLHAVADRSPLPILLDDDSSLSLEMLTELSSNPSFLGLSLGLRSGGLDRLRSVKAATASARREATVTRVFAAITNRMQTQADPAASGNYIAAGALGGGATALATAPPRPPIPTRAKQVGFQLLIASTPLLLGGLEAGAAGAILPFAVCAPQAVSEVFAAWKDGDPRLAAEKHRRLLEAVAEIEGGTGVPALKAACDLNGYFGGKPRLPLLPLTGEQRRRVEALMSGMRN